MRSRALQLGLSFVLLTTGLTWLWLQWGGAAYERFLLAVAGPVLHAFGVTQIVESPAQKRFVSVVPFLVLMWLTPGLSLRRRTLGTLVGAALLCLTHVGLVAVELWSQSSHRLTATPFSTMFPAAMFADSLPFMIWAVVAHRFLSGLFVRALGPRAGGNPAT
jgi:hypothetical protein